MAYVMRTENMFKLLYGRVEEFFEFVIVVVIVVIVMIMVQVEKISEFVFVVIVGIVMTVKTVKRSSEFVIVEVRHKFLPRETDVLESAVKVYGCTPLRVHEALPDHVRHFQELAVCHEGIQLVVVSAEHRDM